MALLSQLISSAISSTTPIVTREDPQTGEDRQIPTTKLQQTQMPTGENRQILATTTPNQLKEEMVLTKDATLTLAKKQKNNQSNPPSTI